VPLSFDKLRMGRLLKGWGSQKTCLNDSAITSADRGKAARISRIKKGHPRIDIISVRGFFCLALRQAS
jgi:hypothetical protein